MDTYLKGNYDYWQKGYYAPNVESYVFRMWGHVLQYEFPEPDKCRMLDYGCGQGAALSFFNQLGFNVYGVDISRTDIKILQKRMNHIADQFSIVDSIPSESDSWWGGDFDLVTAFQSLYFYSDIDMQIRLRSLYNQLKPGGIIYATMMGTKNYCYEHSQPYKNGLRSVSLKNQRHEIDNYFVNFIDSKAELIKTFSMFEKMHTGYYDSCFREDEGCHFHWIYVGKKAYKKE